MFFGRKNELSYLKKMYESNKAEFITLYGRRRIGKTELLNEFAKDKNTIFYSAKECTDYEQLSSFSEKVLKTEAKFKGWEEAFLHLKKMISNTKLVLILDEFPYIVNGNNSIPSILQNLWDHELKNLNIMIVLCGSSMSFIEKKVLSEKNPLYGRMTGVYRLEELNIYEVAEYYTNYSNADILKAYSILGGVPYYFMQFDVNTSIENNIKDAILDKGRILYNEVEFLIKQEMREPQVYYTVIEKIAMGNTKLNDIYNKTLIDKNKLMVYIKNLIDLNLIVKEYPVTEKLKAKTNLHSGIYKLANNYFKFYFSYVFPNISDLEQHDIDGVYNYEIAPSLNKYVSYSFEELCLQYINLLKYKDELPFRLKNVGRWWDKNTEIDIVGFSKDNEYLFGECKWRNEKTNISVLNNLITKSEENFKPLKSIYYIFSKAGFTQELIDIAKNNDKIYLVDLNSLFAI